MSVSVCGRTARCDCGVDGGRPWPSEVNSFADFYSWFRLGEADLECRTLDTVTGEEQSNQSRFGSLFGLSDPDPHIVCFGSMLNMSSLVTVPQGGINRPLP